MNVFIAGGSGTIGFPLVRSLVASGHQVTALSRSAARHAELRDIGASVAVADALDRDGLISAVANARPTHVVHQLTALPKAGPRSARDLEATNRLRVEGTSNLLDAAISAGARRFVAGSLGVVSHVTDGGVLLRVIGYAGASSWPPPKVERSPVWPPRVTRMAQYLNSGILPNGSSAGLVSMLAAAS